MYKKGRLRYLYHSHYFIVNIYVRKKFFGIPYWSHLDTIKDGPHVQEIIKLLNNPTELRRRIFHIKLEILNSKINLENGTYIKGISNE